MAIGALASVYAFGQDDRGTTTLERKTVADQADRDARPFQTREGRLRAKPLDWNATIGKPVPHKALPVNQGKPETTKGGEPNKYAKPEGQKLYPDEWRGLNNPNEPVSLNYSYEDTPPMFMLKAGSSDVFTQYCEGCVTPSTNYPDAAIGKLFSSSGFCSASVISGNNAIVTAAHCCYDRSKKNWVGGWVFAPAFQNGNTPFGTFNWSSATILTSWINSGDVPSDVCVIRLANDNAGRGVTFYTGWLGRSWNFGSIQEHHAIGYPGNLGGGNVEELCTSESFSPSAPCGGGNILNTGCSMTFGSSGGPWIRSYRGGNWVNSVVHGYDSPGCTGTFGQTFNGARFTSGNIATICNAAGC
jgi:V8-like Glu-specific endopeptidase